MSVARNVFLFSFIAQGVFVAECRSHANPPFMLAAGISSSTEQCLVSDGLSVALGSCANAVLAGDGGDLWSFANGQLVSAASSKCLSLRDGDATEGGSVSMLDCDVASKAAGSQWEVLGSGQLKVGMPGELCLSQSGLAPGEVNLATHAAVSASSTADLVAHAASSAVDDNEASFWASRLGDVSEPVTFTIDFGAEAKLASASISWEFPAQAFAISVSGDGLHYVEVYATDSNVLKRTVVPLGGHSASKMKITMYRPHAVHGRFDGHGLYGISSLAVFSAGMNPVVAECAKAAKSADARDKYFQINAGEFNPLAAKALAGELPALDAAQASVAATVSELAEALPKLAACKSKSFQNYAGAGKQMSTAKLARLGRIGGGRQREIVNKAAVGLLIAEARSTIMAARALLV